MNEIDDSWYLFERTGSVNSYLQYKKNMGKNLAHKKVERNQIKNTYI